MSGAASARPARRLNWRLVATGIAAAVVLLLVAANAHLVYVAVVSQPDCVAHTKTPGQDGAGFRAARPAC
ncbi:MAG: hypothetical protein DCC69_14180 [Hyphomicrobiales bacterium]|nr:MAG: hypothetical protein DCC69_14180 [Hyphomicrobiales bacterium]